MDVIENFKQYDHSQIIIRIIWSNSIKNVLLPLAAVMYSYFFAVVEPKLKNVEPLT